MTVAARSVELGVLDEPAPGANLPLGYVLVRGWALSDPPVSSVRILINGRPAARARLGMPRPDVASQLDWPEAPVCGFEAHLDLARRAASGDSVVQAEVTRLDGARFVLSPSAITISQPASSC